MQVLEKKKQINLLERNYSILPKDFSTKTPYNIFTIYINIQFKASTCPGMAERELRLVHSRMDLLQPKAEETNYVELAEWQIVDEGSQI
jgi:hypothetical protein